jgi:cold shock CspA family protein
LVFGSNGIVRRFIKLAGDSMIESTKKDRDRMIVTKYDVYDAMRSFGKELVERSGENDRILVDRTAFFCIRNHAFRFRAPGSEEIFLKLYNKTKQDNLIYPILDQDRHGVTYIFEFDYVYCIYRNIPTHFYLNAEKINLERSVVNGKWIVIPANIARNFIDLEQKLEGEIIMYNNSKQFGFISYLPKNNLFFHKINVISLGSKQLAKGLKVSFRIGRNYKGECAVDIVVLD